MKNYRSRSIKRITRQLHRGLQFSSWENRANYQIG